jgi:hypothetical protein
MWLLARSLTGNVWAAWLAGLVWAFSPYRVAHLGAGHLPLMGTAWIPLCLLYLERVVRHLERASCPIVSGRNNRGSMTEDGQNHPPSSVIGPQSSVRDGALVGLFWSLTALSSWYYAYLLGLFALLYGALRLRHRLFALQWIAAASVGLLVAALLVSPALFPLLQHRPASSHYTLRYIDQWSASPLDFLVPSALHPLWGAVVATTFPQNPQEGLISLGWVPLLLALVGIGAWGRADQQAPTAGWRGGFAGLRGGWLLLGLLAALLALGTTLHLGHDPLRLPAPDWLASKWGAALALVLECLARNPTAYWSYHQEGALLVPLPTLLLYLFLPFFNAMRVWSRFSLFVTLAVAVLAAFGLARIVGAAGRVLVEQRRQWPPWQALLALGLVLFELWPAPLAFGYSRVVPQPVDEWLATQPRGAVALFPPERGWYGYSLWQNRAHGQPLAYGYGTFAPPAFEAASQTLTAFPNPASLKLLRAWQVRYLVVAPEGYGTRWPAVEQALAAAQLKVLWRGPGRPLFSGDRLLSRLPPDPAVPALAVAVGPNQWWINGEVIVYTFP